MASDPTDRAYLRGEQYATGANLSARIALHQRFRVGSISWPEWFFDRLRFPATARILELGCGTGMFWQEMADRLSTGWTLLLTDFSEGMVREAAAATSGLPCGVAVTVAEAGAIPLADRSVDAVVASHMLYHVPDRERALQDIHRVLAPNGALYAATIGETHLHQLRDVVASFASDARPLHAVTHRFSAENGGAQLRKLFADVDEEVLEGELHVTEAQAIADYVRSMATGRRLGEEAIAGITARVQEEIDRHGAFVLDTRNALFTCRP